jgi:L-ascorbate metabolism protein UlaG (beta-lactamase superfamily)
MTAEIEAIGNEGFEIAAGGQRVFIDAFYSPALWVGSAPCHGAAQVQTADLILVTHAHFDHFDRDAVGELAQRTGAVVAGPASVVKALRKRLPAHALLELEPPEAPCHAPARSVQADLPNIRLRAWRTFHSRDHNSYRVDLAGFSFFHDGDNENTHRLDTTDIGSVDALFIATWLGSGWANFVERLNPARWFLMHMTAEELDQQERGRYLPDLCDHVPLPDRLVTLRPGQRFPRPSP